MALDDTQYIEQFDKLTNAITAYTTRPIMYGMQANDKPLKRDEQGEIIEPKEVDYPYFSYNITSHRMVQNIPYTTQSEMDVTVLWKEQWEFTVSFAAIAKNIFEALEQARLLHSWFEETGYQTLSGIPMVKVRTTPITQRDFFLVDMYERRQGFEVVLRVAREIEKVTPRIVLAPVPDGTIIT